MPRANQYGVSKRGKRWQARPYISGKKEWVGTFPTREEARTAAIEAMADLQRRPASKETVDSYARHWLRLHPPNKHRTRVKYQAAADALSQRFSGVRIADVSRADAREFSLANRHHLIGARKMFTDALDDDLIRSNPFFKLNLPASRGRRDIVAVTPEELEKLAELALSSHGNYGPTFRSAVLFMAYTGIRCSELAGLNRADLDIPNERLWIRRQFHEGRFDTPKSDQSRDIYLPPQAVEAIRSLPRQVPPPICDETKGEILFCNKSGRRVHAGSLGRYWMPVRVAFESQLSPARLAEFRSSRAQPQMVLHELRHFTATFLVERGLESWIVAKQLGHADDSLVRRLYSHPRESLATQRLRQAFGANVAPLREVANG